MKVEMIRYRISTEDSSKGNKGIICTEFIFLLTGDFIFFEQLWLNTKPKGNELKHILCGYRTKYLNVQTFEIELL